MRKLLVFVLTYCLVFSSNAFGKCSQDVTILEKEEKAPCWGFLFSPKKELEVRLAVQEKELLEKEIEFKDKKIKLLLSDITIVEQITSKERQKSELWRIRAEESTAKLIKFEEGRAKRDFWFILLGITLTVGAGYAVGQASK